MDARLNAMEFEAQVHVGISGDQRIDLRVIRKV